MSVSIVIRLKVKRSKLSILERVRKRCPFWLLEKVKRSTFSFLKKREYCGAYWRVDWVIGYRKGLDEFTHPVGCCYFLDWCCGNGKVLKAIGGFRDLISYLGICKDFL